MTSQERTLLRQHVEAVWGARLPQIDRDEITLLPESALPAWRLCAADIAEGRVHIWRPDVQLAERTTLLARLEQALLEPPSVASSGISREVAFRLAEPPAIDLAAARLLARPLTRADSDLVEAFWPGETSYAFQASCQPSIGVIVDGRLLSLAHSSRRTAEACELGIDTLSEARRKGYALAATIVWSEAIRQEGLVPIYSAFANNTASLALAVRAGYREFARAATVE